MDESIVKHLEQPAKTMKMSEALRIGCPYVRETRLFSGCAIGTAFKALTGEDLEVVWERHSWLTGPTELVAEAFSIPLGIVESVSSKHWRGEMSREKCADWLEGQGY